LAEHAEHKGEAQNVHPIELYSRILKGRDHSENLRVDGRIILKWNLSYQGGNMWTGFICVSMKVSGINGNATPGSMN
jgi:hypothetical protein